MRRLLAALSGPFTAAKPLVCANHCMQAIREMDGNNCGFVQVGEELHFSKTTPLPRHLQLN
jgi:hypothetical protein